MMLKALLFGVAATVGALAVRFVFKPSGVYRAPPRPGSAAVVGNSLSAHGGYVSILNRLPGYQWDNYGIVGNSTRAMLRRQNEWAKPEYTEILILGGGNDFSPTRTSQWTINNLREMYRIAKNLDARVVAVTSTPWGGYSRWNAVSQQRQDEVNRWILQGGDGLIDVAVDAYTFLKDPRNPRRLNPAWAAPDGLHLNRTGQLALGRHIARVAYTTEIQ